MKESVRMREKRENEEIVKGSEQGGHGSSGKRWKRLNAYQVLSSGRGFERDLGFGMGPAVNGRGFERV